MTGLAVIEILVGMGGSWLFRELLIKTLIPRYQDMQIQFWKFVWGGRAFRVKDQVVTVLAAAILISNIVLAAGVILLLWSVASSAPV
jgi:hypothetical protein